MISSRWLATLEWGLAITAHTAAAGPLGSGGCAAPSGWTGVDAANDARDADDVVGDDDERPTSVLLEATVRGALRVTVLNSSIEATKTPTANTPTTPCLHITNVRINSKLTAQQVRNLLWRCL
jgi:hypothetical protein